MTRPIQILRTGSFVDLHGRAVSFGEAELAQVARCYDPRAHEAPIVVGHPKTDGPAYGWIKSLRVLNGALEAEPDQVDAQFADLVRAGRFKKISVSLFLPGAPQNPKPGCYYLRHVGFLGATPPAVKGLRAVELAGDASGVLELAAVDPRGLVSALREMLVSTLGPELIDRVWPWSADPAATDEPMEALELDGAAFGAAMRTLVGEQLGDEALAALAGTGETEEEDEEEEAQDPPPPPAAELSEAEKTRRAELDAREKELAARERAASRRDHVAFLDGLVRRGQPLPGKREHVVAFMEALERVDAGDSKSLIEVSFGEGERRSLVDLFKGEFLSYLPKQIELAEIGAPGAGGSDADPADVDASASAYRDEQRAKGVVISTSEAVRHVERQR